jgi:hypothetical protein
MAWTTVDRLLIRKVHNLRSGPTRSGGRSWAARLMRLRRHSHNSPNRIRSRTRVAAPSASRCEVEGWERRDAAGVVPSGGCIEELVGDSGSRQTVWPSWADSHAPVPSAGHAPAACSAESAHARHLSTSYRGLMRRMGRRPGRRRSRARTRTGGRRARTPARAGRSAWRRTPRPSPISPLPGWRWPPPE